MTKDKAIEAMRQGKKVTHRFFTNDEWMELHGLNVRFEDGVSMSMDEFFHDRKSKAWQGQWSIFEETTTPPPQTKQ